MACGRESRMSNNIHEPKTLWERLVVQQSLAGCCDRSSDHYSFPVFQGFANSPPEDTSFAKMIPLEHPLYVNHGSNTRDDLAGCGTFDPFISPSLSRMVTFFSSDTWKTFKRVKR